MEFVICKTKCSSFLQITHTGYIDVKERIDAYKHCLSQETHSTFRGLLVDLTMAKWKDSIMDEFTIGELVASEKQLQGVRIAYLHTSTQKESCQFLETVEVNRGVDCRIFTDREEAVQWLESVN